MELSGFKFVERPLHLSMRGSWASRTEFGAQSSSKLSRVIACTELRAKLLSSRHFGGFSAHNRVRIGAEILGQKSSNARPPPGIIQRRIQFFPDEPSLSLIRRQTSVECIKFA